MTGWIVSSFPVSTLEGGCGLIGAVPSCQGKFPKTTDKVLMNFQSLNKYRTWEKQGWVCATCTVAIKTSAQKSTIFSLKHKDVFAFCRVPIVNVNKRSFGIKLSRSGLLPRWHLGKRCSLLLLIGSDWLVFTVKWFSLIPSCKFGSDSERSRQENRL